MMCIDMQVVPCGLELSNSLRWKQEHQFRSTQASSRHGTHRVGKWYEGNTVVGILGKLCEDGELSKGVGSLDLLEQRSHVPSSLLYNVLKQCIANEDLILGRRVHNLSRRCGYDSDAFLATHIIRMYASHGRLEEATQVFTEVAVPNTFMWKSIISAHTDHGEPTEAITLYRQMRESTVKPNSYVFVAVLKACAVTADLYSGREVHADILGSAKELDMFVGSCLVDMYAKCGSLSDARSVFNRLPRRDVVTWTVIIAAYAEHGLGHEALALYERMQQEGLIAPNRVTFLCLLQACASIGAIYKGRQLHAQILRRGLDADVVVGSCLVDMYAKCGSLQDARRVFNDLSTKNEVTWTAMIAGYAQQGLGQEALALYGSMDQAGMSPADSVIFSSLLNACASIGALHEGKKLHYRIQERGLESDLVVGNCLVHMYANCGNLEEARRLFDRLPMKDVVTWNALLNGYAQHSCGRMALRCFQDMQQQGVQPDEVTFVCLLVACSHEGLLNEGERHFKMMMDHGISPTAKHYVCLVDLLGRSGHLDDAENMLQTMPFQNSVVGWTSLLSACKSHHDIKRGRRCFDRLVALEPQSATAYVLVGNIYANAGRWKDVEIIERLRKYAGAKKKPAKAFVEVRNKVHEFTVGEKWGDISSKLSTVNMRIKEEGGHVPQTELVLKAVSGREKEDELCGHAEKLALAYGLLNTPNGSTLLVTKNLRMCSDCHSSTKIMSRLEQREIIVRDAHRVHRFVDGKCSCRDRY